MLLPIDIIRPRAVLIDVQGGGISPGRSATGFMQNADFTGGGLWVVKYQLRPSNSTPLGIRLLSQLGALLNSGVETVDVPLMLDALLPHTGTGYPSTLYEEDIPHDDETFFDDGTGYSQDVLSGELAADASLNAGVVSVRMFNAGPVTGGEVLSIYHADGGERAYRIRQVQQVTEETNATVYSVRIAPTIRAAVPAGSYCRFVRPRVRMNFPPGFTLPLNIEKFWQFSGEISFVETAMTPRILAA